MDRSIDDSRCPSLRNIRRGQRLDISSKMLGRIGVDTEALNASRQLNHKKKKEKDTKVR